MQYEYSGRTTSDAVRKAAKGHLVIKADAGERHSCRQLQRWIAELYTDSEVMKLKIDTLMKRVDDLAESIDENNRNAAVGALSAAAGALGSAARGLVILRRLLRGRKPSWQDLLSAVPIIGGAFLAAQSALSAIQDNREAREVSRELDQLKRMLQATEGTLEELRREWNENRCEEFYS